MQANFVQPVHGDNSTACINSLCMANRLRELRKAAKLTLEELAAAVGTSFSMIQKLETGERTLNESWMRLLSVPLKCKPQDILTEALVPVVGNVGAGGHILPIDDFPHVADNRLQTGWGGQPMSDCMEYVEAPPEGSHEGVVAVRVKGDSMVPAMQDGDLIYYRVRQEGGFDDLINKRCVVKVVDGATMVKEIKSHPATGRYNLFSYNAPMIENVEIEWAARIIFTKYV